MLNPTIAHRREKDGEVQTVANHLQSVAAISSEFASKIGLERVGEVAGLLHDAGKASREFQIYLKSAVGLLQPDADDDYVDADKLKGKVDHSTAGAQWVWRYLKESDPITAQVLALCIASHHSGLIDCVGGGNERYGVDVFARRMAKDDSKTNYAEVINYLPSDVLERCKESLKTDRSAIEQLCRGIANDYRPSEQSIRAQFSLLIRFVFSCLIDADRIDTSNFEFPHLERLRWKPECADVWKSCLSRVEAGIAKLEIRYEIDGARSDISNRCRVAAEEKQGIFSLGVPTGGGKTYSSLRFALHHARKHELERIFFVIPYTSIIDQNAKAVRKLLGNDARFVLENHSNLTPRRQSYRDKVLAANWDAPIVFTTMVQFLESLFGGGTRGARRMHQLANSVIVFDEIQSLPLKCVHLFNHAVNFLVERCSATVVLCTATQPLLHTVAEGKGRLKLSPEGEITKDTEQLFAQLKRTSVINRTKYEGWDTGEIADLAIEQTGETNSCLIVANTKKSARRVFEEIKSQIGDRRTWQIYHLSTNMCPAHRKAILFLIKRRLRSELPVICVSTQLIEAGVDVDFGSAIRFLAGLDSIAQTAGRCNRNGLQSVGKVFVVNAADENLSGLPEIRIAAECTKRIFDDFAAAPAKYDDDLIGPKAMKWFYENYFHKRANEMDYPVPASKIGHDDTILNLLGQNKFAVSECKKTTNRAPEYYFRQAFMTAGRAFEVIDAPTEGVIVPFCRRGKSIAARLVSPEFEHQRFALLREAQQFTVNVFPNVFERLRKQNAISPIAEDIGIFCLDSQFYDPQFGLATEPVSPMEFLDA